VPGFKGFSTINTRAETIGLAIPSQASAHSTLNCRQQAKSFVESNALVFSESSVNFWMAGNAEVGQR
jgi:hypothetical protein